MANVTTINHPIIDSYVNNFIKNNEIPHEEAIDKHLVFEKYINNLVLSTYTNDPNCTYEDMETGNALGIDGVAIFISDRLVTSLEDVDLVISDLKNLMLASTSPRPKQKEPLEDFR